VFQRSVFFQSSVLRLLCIARSSVQLGINLRTMNHTLPKSPLVRGASFFIAFLVFQMLREIVGIKTYPIDEHKAMFAVDVLATIGTVLCFGYIFALAESIVDLIATRHPIRATLLRRLCAAILVLLIIAAIMGYSYVIFAVLHHNERLA
jgi:hypothetical protein